MTAGRFFDRIYHILTLRPVYHTLFWVTLYGAMVSFVLESNESVQSVLANEFISLCFFAVLVYFNLFYLVPNYLARNVLLYLGLVLAASFLVTPIKILVLYIKFSDLPAAQDKLVKSQVFLFIESFLVTLLSTVLRVFTDWWRYQREKQNLQTQTIQSELRFLKSQINPHFLFNTLNNLYALTLKKSDKAPEIVLKLSEIMRYMLYECKADRVPLEKEIEYLRHFIDLHLLKDSRGLNVTVDLDESRPQLSIAPMLLIPFVENAFKHSKVEDRVNGWIKIEMKTADGQIVFQVQNSVPDANFTKDQAGGIGLVNVRRQLELLYPGRYELAIDSGEPAVFSIRLKLQTS